MVKKNPDLKFSQKHPLLFGFMLIAAALVLITGTMAAFTFFAADRQDPGFFAKNKIGVVHVNGLITGSRRVNDWIDRMAADDDIRGVILRINSPGGVVAPSQEIYAAIQRLADKKPVVASLGSVATSGGYYIACGADSIVGNRGTLTASIGVKAQMTNVKELMSKLGIKEQTITSGKLKNAGSPFEDLSPEEKAYFQELVNNLHAQFVGDVASGRDMSSEAVSRLADGRAMTGEQAYEAGLIDELGGFDTALDLLRSKLGITGRSSLVEGPPQERSLLKTLLGDFNIPDQAIGPRWEFLYE
ncbi:MAG: signal peptide peptidase SppA [Desulfonatronovibrionaceae bacterium]